MAEIFNFYGLMLIMSLLKLIRVQKCFAYFRRFDYGYILLLERPLFFRLGRGGGWKRDVSCC